jgi:hypothetical protein
MLFDLKGRRRRVVQATYLMLAVLMGGGLVFFGIGGDVSGGLFDAFSTRNRAGSEADEILRDRIGSARKKLRVNPNDPVALKTLVRANYQLATAQTGRTGLFPPDARDELEGAARAWERYLATKPDPIDASLANLMLQAYGPGALEQNEKAAKTAEQLAEQRETPEAYVLLVQYASLAGQTRIADLAGEKAIDLAPEDRKKEIKQQVEQAKAASALQQVQQQGG